MLTGWDPPPPTASPVAAAGCDLVILDADNLAAPPAARVHLPRRVPAGFHGNWLPDVE
jgi:carotenoid cleavage dioxygenase-like enzyme